MKFRLLVGIIATIGLATTAIAGTLFDPTRHMRVDEVRPGMTGYGLSVFSGTKIEKFDVVVVSVLRNYNPRRHVVLIRCSGQNLEHSGAVAGMSGSPVFLRDEQGKDRMIGAFAYGWELAKDPIAGVQPIEYMLELDGKPAQAAGARAQARSPRQSWNVLTATAGAWKGNPPDRQRDAAGLVPLAAPLMVAGISAPALERLKPLLDASGLTLFRGGGGGEDDSVDPPIEPGSVIIAPLLTGDAAAYANGTCTEVIGDRVFAFGHPFNNEGQISLPMASGAVNAIVSSLQSSFKIATIGKTKGTFDTDEVVGIAGRFGEPPAQAPIDIRVTHASGAQTAFRFSAVRHPRFLPMLGAIAVYAAITGQSDLPQYHTIEYKLSLTFDNGRVVHIHNVDSNVDPMQLVLSLASPIMAAAENPFERVLLKEMSGEVTIKSESRDAQILAAQLPKTRFHPGDTIRAFVTYRPFRADEANLPIEIELPRDLPDGQYQLVIGDWTRFLSDEASAKPFRFRAESTDEVFSILNDISAIRHDAIYVRLVRQSDGVAMGRVAMVQLPSSRRQVLMGAGRSNFTPFVTSDVTVIRTDHVMSGAAEFTIKVEGRTKVEPGSVPTTKPAG